MVIGQETGFKLSVWSGVEDMVSNHVRPIRTVDYTDRLAEGATRSRSFSKDSARPKFNLGSSIWPPSCRPDHTVNNPVGACETPKSVRHC